MTPKNIEYRLTGIRTAVLNCDRCGKHYLGKSACGIGNKPLESGGIFFVGMNPWTKDGRFDIQKGKGIKILLRYIKEWKIKNWFFDNVVKCQTKPKQHHGKNCFPYLKAQIEILDPRLIVAFGAFAEEHLEGHFPYTRVPHFSSFLYPGRMSEDEYYLTLKKVVYRRPEQCLIW